MDLLFRNDDLDRLETDARFSAGLPPEVVTAFRKAINYIRQAMDERDLRARKAFHFEKLRADREGQYSLRLNRQWRLVVELEGQAPSKVIAVLSVENYHKD